MESRPWAMVYSRSWEGWGQRWAWLEGRGQEIPWSPVLSTAVKACQWSIDHTHLNSTSRSGQITPLLTVVLATIVPKAVKPTPLPLPLLTRTTSDNPILSQKTTRTFSSTHISPRRQVSNLCLAPPTMSYQGVVQVHPPLLPGSTLIVLITTHPSLPPAPLG